ncbi:MAG TPA: sensor histidine kinase [Solirubrobacteraceae bacterium]|jgi:signal transduction histidine kinase
MRFEIDPGVVFRLGEDLISDDAQALAELIKNAYDADSPWVRVRVDTASATPSVHGRGELIGAITVEDAGAGMSREQVEHGWLRIAVSQKRRMKAENKTTPKGRTPLGDKGLGRLGAQRLGDEVELDTKARDSEALRVRFSWADFASSDTLSEVPVLEEPSTRPRTGTTIRVLGLREHGYWSGGKTQRQHLLRELSQIISPYEGVDGFRVSIEIDGGQLDLFELTSRLRDTAEARYELQFDGRDLRIRGDLRLAFLAPNRTTGPDVENFQRFGIHDAGEGFREYLQQLGPMADYGLRRPRRKNAFAGFEWRVPAPSLSELYRDENSELISPGPFHGEIDSFDLGHSSAALQSIFDSAAQYRSIVKEFAGVRVYRDGFRVRTDRDPLGLARGATSSRSTYGLDPASTSGYLAISARDNAMLVEKTDREGFQDTPAFRNFSALLSRFSGDVDTLHSAVGRAWVAYVKDRLAAEAPVEDAADSDEAADVLAQQLEEGRELSGRVAATSAQINTITVRAQELEAEGDEADPEALAEASRELRDAVGEAQALLVEIEAYLTRLTSAAALPMLLGHEIRSLRDQVVLSQETMSLGITAEALVHELMNVCDQLESRASNFAEKAVSGKVTDRSATAFADFVRSTARSLRKQTSHLQPSLRYVRDRKDAIDIQQFLEELADHYRLRIQKDPITIAVLAGESFTVRMNRGKLTQIFDNLLLNSEYWVREALRQGASAGTIELTCDRPMAAVADSGPGISPERAARVFEPFVTTKPDGRGLGLFIVRQLLDSEGCSIYFAPDRNEQGNHNRFVIDLSGAVAQ